MVTSPITPCIVVEAKVDFMKARWHLWWKQTIKRDLNVSLFIRKKHQASWRFPWTFVKNDPCFHDRNEEQSRNCCETWRLKFAEVYLTRACLRSPQVQRNLKKIKTFCNKTCPQSQKLLSESQVTSLPSTKQLKTEELLQCLLSRSSDLDPTECLWKEPKRRLSNPGQLELLKGGATHLSVVTDA